MTTTTQCTQTMYLMTAPARTLQGGRLVSVELWETVGAIELDSRRSADADTLSPGADGAPKPTSMKGH